MTSDATPSGTLRDTMRAGVRDVSGIWWWFLILGVLWTWFGMYVLSYRVGSLAAVAALVGVAFLFGGITQLAVAARVQSWRWLFIVAGILSVAAGIVTFVWPGRTLYIVAIFVAWYLIIFGVMHVVASLAGPKVQWWWAQLLLGIAEGVLGVWAVRSWQRSLLTLVTLVGVWAIFYGVSEIFAAFSIREAGKRVSCQWLCDGMARQVIGWKKRLTIAAFTLARAAPNLMTLTVAPRITSGDGSHTDCAGSGQEPGDQTDRRAPGRKGRRRRLGARCPGALVGVRAGVDGVQHHQPRVVDRPLGVVDRVGCVAFRPVRVTGRRAGVELLGPLVDLRLEVVHSGGGVGLHLRPLAPCAGGGLPGLLLGVLDGQVHVDLGLADALPKLVMGLGGGSLCRRLGLRGVLLERVELFGEVHASSLGGVDCVDCRSGCPQ